MNASAVQDFAPPSYDLCQEFVKSLREGISSKVDFTQMGCRPSDDCDRSCLE